jgi:hypothetical protein
MRTEEEEIIHPMSGKRIKGFRLEAGDVLKAGDVYDSPSGVWKLCSRVGETLAKRFAAICVRPSVPVSKSHPTAA